jgi:hypothetical protein
MVAFEATAPGVIEIRMLPRLKLTEALERYRIEEPINEPIDREQWQDAASRDVIRE